MDTIRLIIRKISIIRKMDAAKAAPVIILIPKAPILEHAEVASANLFAEAQVYVLLIRLYLAISIAPFQNGLVGKKCIHFKALKRKCQ